MVKIGLIQMEATPLKVDDNLSKADYYIKKTAVDGAELVVLPEMFNVGLSIEKELMALGEPLDGHTVTWLKERAEKYHVFILTSIYERFKGYFYNTMVMIGYDGTVQWYRKRNPTVQERLVWKRSDTPGPGIFETPFGRIGGAICFDSFSRETFEGFKQSDVGLIIMIALWGTFIPVPKYPDSYLFKRILNSQSYLASEIVPKKYAEQLGVPAVFANQCGKINITMTHPGLYPMPDWKNVDYVYEANSNIFDASGKKLIKKHESNSKKEFCAVESVHVKKPEKRPAVTKVDVPPKHLSKDYYFVNPPFMFRLYQRLCFTGFEKEYEKRCAAVPTTP